MSNTTSVSVWCRRLLPLLPFVGTVAPIVAQGGLRWTDVSQQPVLHVREHANRDWTLCFSGWSMTGGVALGGSDQAAAVGTDVSVHTVRSVSCDVVQGGAGGVALGGPLFPFVDDPAVDSIFSTPRFNWTGFRALTNGPVPAHDFGALSFRVPMTAPYTPLSLLPLLANAQVGAAQIDAQRQPVGQVFQRTPASVVVAAICYYKFDRGIGNGDPIGNFAVNYAGVEGGAAGTARLQRQGGGPLWAGGRFDSALAAGASCDTGFYGDLGGSVSIAWFMRGPNTNTESTVFSMNGWRCFTGGRAGRGLICEGWGGPVDLDLSVDVQSLATNGFVHVALVVDSDRRRATWLVNGTSRRVIDNITRVNIPASPAPLRVGASQGRPCVYDLDEFHLRAEAVSNTIVADWASSSPAAGQAFSRACGANLQATRAPALGVEVAYRLEATPGATAALFLGRPPQQSQTPLPFDLGLVDAGLAGCLWYSDMFAALPAVTVPTNPPVALFRLRIPIDINLRGLELYNQGIAVEARPAALRATNAHVLSIE